MKRKAIVCGMMITMLLAGCAKQQSQMSYIGAETAKQTALADAGLTLIDVDSVTADLSSRNGQDYYQIDITAEGQSYRYNVDALTGVIIESNVPETALAGTENAAAGGRNEAGAQQTEAGTDPSGKRTDGGGSAGGRPGDESSAASSTQVISAEDAKGYALTHAGLTSDQVTFVKSNLEYDKGRQVYEVEFYTQDQVEYDYEIDASTGEVISYDYEVEGCLSGDSSGSAITEEQAKELALTQVPGASTEDIREFKTDYEDGRIEYEGKIIYDDMKYEFEIDGYSGAIRSWEAEPVSR